MCLSALHQTLHVCFINYSAKCEIWGSHGRECEDTVLHWRWGQHVSLQHWYFFFKFLEVGWDWVHLVCQPLIGLLYQFWMIDDDECGKVGWMRIGRGNQSTQRKPAPVSLYPPQIPHDLSWAWTWAATVESQWLTIWAIARPLQHW
jgi:hypothetical protein